MKRVTVVPPDLPAFVANRYKYGSHFLREMMMWATDEFEATKYWAAVNLKIAMILKLRKMSPAYVLISHPYFVDVINKMDEATWRTLDTDTQKMFAEAYKIWLGRQNF